VIRDKRTALALESGGGMSVSVLVCRWPPPSDGSSGVLFSHDVAGTLDFRDYWHLPAIQLGLDLLAGVYDRGRSFRSEDLGQLLDELEKLERYWAGHDFAGQTRGTATFDSDAKPREEPQLLHDCLVCGLEAVRRAVAIAREHGAALSLG
jgi:hypothetical protein